jgi:hypothetical protein
MIKTIDCSSWEEFKSIYADRLHNDSPNNDKQFLFRGESDIERLLNSSFDQRLKDIIEEDQLFSNFKAVLLESEECPAWFTEINDESEEKQRRLRALARHHGLPSPLLDWSESPYVAAFFAFQRLLLELARDVLKGANNEIEKVGIWALNSEDEVWKGNGFTLIRPFRTIDNRRLINQQGWFMFCKPGSDIDSLQKYVLGQKSGAEPHLWLFTIPAHYALEAMDDLKLMGINNYRLMGGIDGVAQSTLDNVLIKYLKDRGRSHRSGPPPCGSQQLR